MSDRKSRARELLKDEFGYLRAKADSQAKELAAEKKRADDAESNIASLGDVINQELRENGPADVGQYYRSEDMKNGVRYLVDLMRRKNEAAEASLAEEKKRSARFASEAESLSAETDKNRLVAACKLMSCVQERDKLAADVARSYKQIGMLRERIEAEIGNGCMCVPTQNFICELHEALTSTAADHDAFMKSKMGEVWEKAAVAVESGRFLHDKAPTALFAKEVAAMLRRNKAVALEGK